MSEEAEGKQLVAAPPSTAPSVRASSAGGQGGGGGNSAHVDIFVRIKPVPKPSGRLMVEAAESKVEFNIPRCVCVSM